MEIKVTEINGEPLQMPMKEAVARFFSLLAGVEVVCPSCRKEFFEARIDFFPGGGFDWRCTYKGRCLNCNISLEIEKCYVKSHDGCTSQKESE